jgi:hypothetical protein
VILHRRLWAHLQLAQTILDFVFVDPLFQRIVWRWQKFGKGGIRMHRNRSVYKIVLAATLSLQFACQPTLALPNRITVTVPIRGTSLNQVLNSSKGSTLGKVAGPFTRYENILNATPRPTEDARAAQSSTLQHFFLIGNAAAQPVASGKSDTTGVQDKSLSSRTIINSLNSTYKGDQVYLMEPGSLLIMHDSPVSLQTNEGNVHISKGSVAFVVQIGQEVAVYNLTGDKTGTVAAKVGSQIIPIPLGHAVILSEVSSNIKKCPVSQCIDLNSAVNFARVGAVNVIAAKFNYSSALDNCPQFQEFVNSKIPDQRKTADLLLKYTAAQASAGGDAQQASTQSTGQPDKKTEQVRAKRSRENVFMAMSSTVSNSTTVGSSSGSTSSGTTGSGSSGTGGTATDNTTSGAGSGSGSGTTGVSSNPPSELKNMSPAEWKSLVTGVTTGLKIWSKVKNFGPGGPKSPDRTPPTGDKDSPNPDDNPTGDANSNGNPSGDNQPDQDPGTGSQNSTNSVNDPDDNLSPNTIRIISQESAPKQMGTDEPGAPKMLEPEQIINQTAEAADKSFEDDPDEPLEDDPDFIPIELAKVVRTSMFGFQPIGKLVPTTTTIRNTSHLKLKGILNIGPQFTTPAGWTYVGVPVTITNYNAAVTNTYAQYKICLECGAKINVLTPKITSTQTQITNLQTQISGVQQKLGTISTLQAQYNSWPKQEQLQNRGEEQKLLSAQKSLNQTLQSLNTQLQAQQSTLSTLQSTVQTLTVQGNSAATLESLYEQQVSILYGILPKEWCAWQQIQVST